MQITHSLLRYPGSKARLVKFISDTISLNKVQKSIFIEPFCGGASVSIALLETNVVEKIILNDIDPLIASLWKCVFSKDDARWLAKSILRVPLTLDYWEYQKQKKSFNRRELALKCLYLNRTSFSGILHNSAGPIGGRNQKKWTIGCRFNREKLASRVLELSRLSNRVITTQRSWNKVISSWEKEKKAFFYFDPPFYHKAKKLYRFIFQESDHKNLCNTLKNFRSPWVLSYDNAIEIRELYARWNLTARVIDSTYSAHPIGGNSFIGRELVYSNLKELPLPNKPFLQHTGLTIRKFLPVKLQARTQIRLPLPRYELMEV